MQGQIQSVPKMGSAMFGRGFVMLASAWLVAQAHHGAFLGPWSDEASLPGNACWLLILYCQLRLALGWLESTRLDRRVAPELSMQLLAMVTLELASLASGNPLSRPEFGQLMLFAQPLVVLFGFAALHRRAAQSA
ncbi:hypothetical protein CAP39_08195 [Sphingomonas sp. IBVSS1]|nr:hypothetical protein CAP39_08195 [Sphingomonas sp. IBVSS1]